MYGNGFNAHLLTRPYDAERDLAPVGDQYFLKHSDTSMDKMFKCQSSNSKLIYLKFGF
jgi:hypothetical protein